MAIAEQMRSLRATIDQTRSARIQEGIVRVAELDHFFQQAGQQRKASEQERLSTAEGDQETRAAFLRGLSASVNEMAEETHQFLAQAQEFMEGVRGDLNEKARELASFLEGASRQLQEVTAAGRAERMDFIEETRNEVDRLAGETERFIIAAETDRLRAFAANSDERAAALNDIFKATAALVDAVSQDLAEAHEAFFGIFSSPPPVKPKASAAKPAAPAAKKPAAPAAKPAAPQKKATQKRAAPKKKAARKR